MIFDREQELFLSALRFERGLSENTCAAYARDIRFFADFLVARGRTGLAEVTKDDLLAYAAQERAAGLKGSTRARRTAAIRLPSECAACDSKDVCRSCAAMIYTETGSYDKKPQYRCDLLRATGPACRALLKEDSQ